MSICKPRRLVARLHISPTLQFSCIEQSERVSYFANVLGSSLERSKADPTPLVTKIEGLLPEVIRAFQRSIGINVSLYRIKPPQKPLSISQIAPAETFSFMFSWA